MRWLLVCWAGVVAVLVGCAAQAQRITPTTATHRAGLTALEVVIRLGLAQSMAAADHASGVLSAQGYRDVLHTLRAGNDAAILLGESLTKPPEARQLGDRAKRILADLLPVLATQLGAAGAKVAEMTGDVERISVQQAREDASLLALLRTRAQANLAVIDAALKASP